ncbi:hypothetical protein HU200_062863 [Digitaria exilis]|uniref:Glycosyltransferase n=1 Tax=Digitaria exilis TaxID=1010633 RepID=A0A835DZJ9_9POAL|nr:hypothetical protein HU200_062863 [Digitaria exilis]
MEKSTPAPHVAMLATPGMGHLIPLAELAKRLAARHAMTTTLLTFASIASATQRAFLASLPPSISVTLPLVDLFDLPPDALIETRMSVECTRSLPTLTAILAELTPRPAAFVTARRAGVERRCLFFPGSLHSLTLFLHLPELSADMSGEFVTSPSRCVSRGTSSPSYAVMVHLVEHYLEADAFLVNSFNAVEPEAAAALRHPKPGRPPVYPIGPLTVTAAINKPGNANKPPRDPCLEWLDRQPARSVIFVSFGSGGALPEEEMSELTLGLELSGQRFLWVVRSPSTEGSVSANYYDAESKNDPLAYLPEGFVERTKGLGSWCQVLAHEGTGGFLTHCGWNSTLESLVHGVPMVAWPLYAEQRLNAVMLTKGVGAAIRLPETKEKETIATVVRKVMVGEGKGARVRAKVAELQKAVEEGLREGGAATATLDGVVENWVGGN